MATIEPLTDAATTPQKPPVNKGGRPTKASLEAKARAKHDPLASVTGDRSLDGGPVYAADVSSRVPKPPHFRYGTDQPSPRRPEHFFQWWAGLPAGAKNSTIAYVYRNYPVIQIKTPDSKSPTGFKLSSQIDKRSGADPLTSLDDVLHYYGSGNYTIRFNQANPSKAVCMCIIQGLRDEQHPPVLDPTTLAIEDPANKPYIEGLRMRGIKIPGVDPMEEDMAGHEAIDRMAGTIERLSERNAALANRPPAAPPVVKQQDDGIVAKAFSTSMDMMANVSAVQNKMLTDAVAKVQEVNSTANDPLAMLDKLAGVLKSLAPAPVVQHQQSGPSPADMLLQASIARADKLELRIFEMQASQLTLLQGMLAKSQETPPAAGAAKSAAAGTPGTPTTALEMLRELVKLKDGLGALTGEAERGENPAVAVATGGPWWAAALTNLPQLLQMGMGIMAMYSQASYNNAIARVGAVGGQPAALPMPPVMPEMQAVTAAEPGPGDEIPTPPTNTNTPLPHPGDSTMAAYHAFLAQLEKPLRLSLENNETGEEFAEKLVEFHGQMAYDLLHNLGKDQLIQILSTYPPIWQVVTAIPQKFNQFLDEFMAYGEAPEPPAPPPHSQPHPQPHPQPIQPATGLGAKAHATRAGGGGAGKPVKVGPGPASQ